MSMSMSMRMRMRMRASAVAVTVTIAFAFAIGFSFSPLAQVQPVQAQQDPFVYPIGAELSSAYSGPESRPASNCLDNSESTICQSSEQSSEPAWLQIDFGAPSVLSYVSIANRLDCCRDRINGFQLRLGNENRNPDSASVIYTDTVGNHENDPIWRAISIDLSAAGQTPGRYLFVYQPTNPILNLGGVSTRAWRSVSGSRLPLVGASMSSAFDGGRYPASNCIDGDYSTYCHTDEQVAGWVKLDLGAARVLSFVRIINRQDCCRERINGFQIRLGHENDNPDSAAVLYTDTVGNHENDPSPYYIDITLSAVGRYLYVYLPTVGVLNIGDIEVWGEKLYSSKPDPVFTLHPSSPPPFGYGLTGRYFSTSAVCGSKMFLMAGYEDKVPGAGGIYYYNDVYEWADSATGWTLVNAHAPWAPRTLPTTVGVPVDSGTGQGTILMTGGYLHDDATGDSEPVYDSWLMDCATYSWEQLSVNHTWPQYGYQTVVWGSKVIMVAANTDFPTAYSLDVSSYETLKTAAWQPLSQSGPGSGWVSNGFTTVAVYNEQLYVTLQSVVAGEQVHELWRLSSLNSDSHWVQLTNSAFGSFYYGRVDPVPVVWGGRLLLSGGGTPSDGLYAFDDSTDTWTILDVPPFPPIHADNGYMGNVDGELRFTMCNEDTHQMEVWTGIDAGVEIVPVGAMLSSTSVSGSFAADHAIDDDLNTEARSHGPTTCSDDPNPSYPYGDPYPWLRIDLGATYIVKRITIDSPGLGGFSILLSDADETAAMGGSALPNTAKLVYRHVYGGLTHYDFMLPDARGYPARALFIVANTAPLRLTHVRVWGEHLIGSRLVPVGASLSSEFRTVDSPHPASNCIDGDYSTMCHTSETVPAPAWIQIDLGAEHELSFVRVVNRQDQCAWCRMRTNGFQLRLGNDDNDPSTAATLFTDTVGVDENDPWPHHFNITVSTVGQTPGRYLYLYHPTNGILNIGEIEAWGAKIVSSLASPASVSLSSTSPSVSCDGTLAHASFSAFMLTDGDPHTLAHSQEFTDPHPYVQVAFNGPHVVTRLIITNRMDCCQNRINGFEILIGDVADQPSAATLMYQDSGVTRGDAALTEPQVISVTMPTGTDPIRPGKFLFIQPGPGQVLNLAEVQVEGYSMNTAIAPVLPYTDAQP